MSVAIQGSRVVITGGAGFIGSHIADQCAQRGAREIVILDDFSRGRPENLAKLVSQGKIRVVRGDICDLGCVEEALCGAQVVFHQAALRITQCAANPRKAHDVLATGAFNVVEAAAKRGIGKVIAASSASVYGMACSFPTEEAHHPYGNRTLYGAQKTYLEGLLRSFHEMRGLGYIALRYFNAYGPRMDVYGKYTEVMIRWMERIEAGQAPIVFGDGGQTMDFVYVEDIARANLLAAEAAVSDEVFNVASGTETSLLELARIMLDVMGSDLDVEFVEERKVNPVRRRLADTRKARDTLGFEAQVPLREGVRRLVEWWRAERKEGSRSPNG